MKGHFLFTEKLTSDFKAYWLEYHDETISDEQAEQYLNSLADLFLAFVESRKSAISHAP